MVTWGDTLIHRASPVPAGAPEPSGPCGRARRCSSGPAAPHPGPGLIPPLHTLFPLRLSTLQEIFPAHRRSKAQTDSVFMYKMIPQQHVLCFLKVAVAGPSIMLAPRATSDPCGASGGPVLSLPGRGPRPALGNFLASITTHPKLSTIHPVMPHCSTTVKSLSSILICKIAWLLSVRKILQT